MQLDYPSDFNVPAFPAGSRIAVSRFMGIVSCVLFVVIVFVCVLLLWGVRSQRIDPFIVTIDELTGSWSVVGHTHGNAPRQYSAANLMQQSVVVKFAAHWFTISDDATENDTIWNICDRTKDCGIESGLKYGDEACAMYCISGDDMFIDFLYNVVPKYQIRFNAGETWFIDKTAIKIEPAGTITDLGGTWRISADVLSNLSGRIQIVAFAKVAVNTQKYPQTLGFYVADFNAYKIN